MISITTVATYESTETAEPAEVLADFEQCIIDRAKINRMAKTIVGMHQG